MWRPDSAFVISLESRPDRRATLPLQLENLGFPVRVFDAVDGKLYPPPVSRFYTCSDEAWGSSRSHVGVLTKAKGTVLVLEDDVLIRPDFRDKMDQFMDLVPPNWEALMLGGEHALPPEPVLPGLVRCVRTIRTHAYVLRAPLVREALRVIEGTRRHYDITLGVWLGGRDRTYAPSPFLIGYSGSPSSIPDSDMRPPMRVQR